MHKLKKKLIFADVNGIGAARFLSFVYGIMEKELFYKVVETAAAERGLVVADIKFDDDDNVFEVTIDRPEADVDLADCEYVHRAVLTAFDRDVEDYSLTVSSVGIDAAEADEMLKSTNE